MRASNIDIWDIITNTDRWCDWGPTVRDVDCDITKIDQGSTGRIQTIFLNWLDFEITEYHDKTFWKWRVSNIEGTGHTLISHSPSSCTLYFDVPWWAPFYLPVCWLALWRISRMCRTSKDLPNVLPTPTN